MIFLFKTLFVQIFDYRTFRLATVLFLKNQRGFQLDTRGPKNMAQITFFLGKKLYSPNNRFFVLFLFEFTLQAKEAA